jgi:malate synthase
MPRTHDVGGIPGGPIKPADHQLEDWEILAEGLSSALGRKRIRTTDEHRRAREDMDPELYLSLSYYERWIVGNEALLVEKGLLTHEEVDRRVAELSKGEG